MTFFHIFWQFPSYKLFSECVCYSFCTRQKLAGKYSWATVPIWCMLGMLTVPHTSECDTANSLRPDQNASCFAHTIFKWNFLKKKTIWILISLLVPGVLIGNKSAPVQGMDRYVYIPNHFLNWCGPYSLQNICIARSCWQQLKCLLFNIINSENPSLECLVSKRIFQAKHGKL